MDIRKLDVFRKVVDLKSFTKAAEAAQLSQPTVSEHMRNLEEELGMKLVDRLGRQTVPTPAGQVLYRYAVRMVQLQQEALQALASYHGTLSGEVRIGASTIPGAYLLPGLLADFCRQHPAIRPLVDISDSRTVASRLSAGGCDLGLVGAVWNERGLQWTPLFADILALAVPPDHPLAAETAVTVDALPAYPFVFREQGSGTRKVIAALLERAGSSETELKEAATLGSNEAVREAVKAGIGISILSRRSLIQDVQAKTLVALPLEAQGAERPIFLLQHKNREPSPVTAALIDHLLAAGDV